jgi:hypothetical protein
MSIDYNNLSGLFSEKDKPDNSELLSFLNDLSYVSNDYLEIQKEDESGEYEEFYLEHRILEFTYQENRFLITQTINPFYSDAPVGLNVELNGEVTPLHIFLKQRLNTDTNEGIEGVFHSIFETI